MKNFLLLLAMVVLGAANSYAADTFPWSLALHDGDLTVSVAVPEHYYLYKEATAVQVSDAAGKVFPAKQTPESADHFDEFSEENVPVYPGGATASWHYVLPNSSTPWQVTVSYQGCRENSDDAPGICFPPEEASYQVTADGAVTPGVTASATQELTSDLDAQLPTLQDFTLSATADGYLDEGQFLAFLNGSRTESASAQNDFSWLWWILLAIGGGLALNLTPCVLPMIPVNLAIIGAGKQAESRWAALIRASFYGGGMMLTYGVLGLLVVLAGAKFGSLNATWWFNAIIAVVFAVLALAMSGLFNLDFAQFGNTSKIAKLKAAPSIIAFALGIAAALLAGACVAPVVIAVLTLAATQYADGAWWALGLPFLLGFGMALPWPLIALGLRVLPRPGGWMVWVKYVFAVFILGMALYYGHLAWSLARVEVRTDTQLAALESGFQAAKTAQKPLLLDFYASWCKNCKAMEATVFPAPAVRKRLDDFVVVKFHAENLDAPEIQELLRYCSVKGLPAFAIFTPKR